MSCYKQLQVVRVCYGLLQVVIGGYRCLYVVAGGYIQMFMGGRGWLQVPTGIVDVYRLLLWLQLAVDYYGCFWVGVGRY